MCHVLCLQALDGQAMSKSFAVSIIERCHAQWEDLNKRQQRTVKRE